MLVYLSHGFLVTCCGRRRPRGGGRSQGRAAIYAHQIVLNVRPETISFERGALSTPRECEVSYYVRLFERMDGWMSAREEKTERSVNTRPLSAL